MYLPDDLAEAVKEANLPVSVICQASLEQAVRQLTTIKQLVASDLDSNVLGSRLPRFTDRALTAFRLAVEQARTAGAPLVGTEHLLNGLLVEGDNLALPAQNRANQAPHSGSADHWATLLSVPSPRRTPSGTTTSGASTC